MLSGCLSALVFVCGTAAYAQDTSGARETSAAAEINAHSLFPAWLAQIGGTISFEADSIDVEDLTLTDVRIPVVLTGNGIELAEGRATSGVGVLAISGTHDYAGNETLIRVSGDSLSFDDDEEPPPKPGALIFDNEQLIPDWVRDIHGEVIVGVDIVVIDEMQFKTVKGPIKFTDRGFTAHGVATVGKGSLTVDIEHVYDTAETSIKTVGSDISLGTLRLTRDYIEDAPTDFALNLIGKGKTGREFVSTMDGFLSAEIGSGWMNNTQIDRLSQNIFALTLSSISPIAKGTARERLDCGALRLEFDDGKAIIEHGIVLRTDKIAIVGSGFVDLKNETLALDLEPTVRQGIKINRGGAVSLIRVSGRLDEPDLTIQKGGLLKGGVSLGTAFVTLGLSKAAEALYDWGTSSEIACEIAVQD